MVIRHIRVEQVCVCVCTDVCLIKLKKWEIETRRMELRFPFGQFIFLVMKDYQSPDLIKEITWELVTSQMTKGLEG